MCVCEREREREGEREKQALLARVLITIWPQIPHVNQAAH